MKKTILLLFLLYLSGIYGQCIRTEMYPYNNVISNNLGAPQLISDCSNTITYAQINNIENNTTYQFTCKIVITDVHKYITVTTLSDVVIASGISPLNVSNITVNKIKVHYSEDALCESSLACVTTTIQTILPCPAPINVQANNITTSDVTFTWAAGGLETSWEVLVLPSDSAAPTSATTGTVINTTPEYLYTNLVEQNHYKFYIRANCGDGVSPWNGPLNFDSACLPVDDFYQTFNTTPYNTIPDCWSTILRGQNITSSANITTVVGTGNGGTNCIMMGNGTSGIDSDIIMISPKLGSLSAGTHRLKVFLKSYSATSVEIGTLNNNTNTAVFTPFDEIVLTPNFVESIIDFSSYAGTDTYIGFRFKAITNYNNMFIDDVRWEFTPLCPDVTNILVPTSTTNSVTLSWDEPQDVSNWEVVYGDVSEVDPTSLIPNIQSFSEPLATISGLNSNFSYKAWVRSSCGDPNGNGNWMGPVTFTTACSGVSEFSEGFETVTLPELPDCWTSILRGNSLSSDAGVKVMNYGAYEGVNSVILNNNEEGNVSDILLVTPHLSNLSAGTHRLKFFADGEMPTSLEIGTLNSNTQNAEFTVVEELSITGSYQEFVVDFTFYTGTDTNIGFRISSNQYTTLFLDNIRWELAPLCPDVTDVTVSEVTINSATITWEAGGGLESQWEVVYGDVTATDPNLLVPISPNPVVETLQITGLDNSTTYKVWIRSICGELEGNGAWMGPVLFNTACLPVTLLDESFDSVPVDELPACWSSILRGDMISPDAKIGTASFNSNSNPNAVALDNSYSVYPVDIILVSPNLENISAGTHRLQFYAKGYSEGALEIGTLDGNTQTAVFTPIQNVEITDTYALYTVNFSANEVGDNYIGIRHNSNSMFNTIFVDDIIWEPAPLCPDVTNITVLEKTTTTANFSWADTGTGDWQVVYDVASVTNPALLVPSDILTSPNTQLTGLTASTSYNMWVRTVCGEPNGNGAWIGPITFTTDCLPNTSFNEGFENALLPALPNCWSSIIRGASVNGYIDAIGYMSYQGSQAVHLGSLDSSGDFDIILVSPSLSNLATGTHQLKFNLASYSECNIEIGTLNSNNPNAVFTPLPSGLIPATSDYEEHVIDFSGYTGTNTYIGFRLNSSNLFTTIYLDSISWEPSLGANVFEGTPLNHFPNPVKDLLHLSYENSITEITIFNMLGQKVLSHTSNSNKVQVDMSRLSSGSYILKVVSGNEIKTIKVMKE